MAGRIARKCRLRYRGDSVGRWEGDVFVVETKNFTDDQPVSVPGVPPPRPAGGPAGAGGAPACGAGGACAPANTAPVKMRTASAPLSTPWNL